MADATECEYQLLAIGKMVWKMLLGKGRNFERKERNKNNNGKTKERIEKRN